MDIVHYNPSRLGRISLLHPERSDPYERNSWYISDAKCCLIESWGGLANARHYAKFSADFRRKHGCLGIQRQLWKKTNNPFHPFLFVEEF